MPKTQTTYLQSTIESLESTLALAKAGLREAKASEELDHRMYADIASYTKPQMQRAVAELKDGDLNDDALFLAMFERAAKLAEGKAKEIILKWVKTLDQTTQEHLYRQAAFQKMLGQLRPEVAKDIIAVTQGRGSIFCESLQQATDRTIQG